jgi:hypothetical protein
MRFVCCRPVKAKFTEFRENAHDGSCVLIFHLHTANSSDFQSWNIWYWFRYTLKWRFCACFEQWAVCLISALAQHYRAGVVRYQSENHSRCEQNRQKLETARFSDHLRWIGVVCWRQWDAKRVSCNYVPALLVEFELNVGSLHKSRNCLSTPSTVLLCGSAVAGK